MLENVQRIHLIGIGGIGVSAVARALHGLGFSIQGSDVRESAITLALRELGMTVTIGHGADNLAGADLVVVSTAIPKTNPEWIAADNAGIPVVHRAEILGAMMRLRRAYGVIGTHGKGTVTSMLTWILKEHGADPAYMIGAMCHNLESNAHVGEGPWAVEVDESDGSLVHTTPEVVILNNLELDHLNYYPSWEKLQTTIQRFFNDNDRLESVFVNVDDPGVRRLVENTPGLPYVTFGNENTDAQYRARGVQVQGMTSTFEVLHKDSLLGEISLQVPGLYNTHNAMGAIACALEAGVPFASVQAAMGAFKGLENRFTLADVGGVQVVKDYISHPTGIQRVLEAASDIARGPITAVFKPYRFTMIHYLQDEYKECFRKADHTLITTMYTAGEVPIEGVDTPFLCNKIRESGSTVEFIPEMEDIVPYLENNIDSNSMVIFFGGDDLFRLADGYLERLESGGIA